MPRLDPLLRGKMLGQTTFEFFGLVYAITAGPQHKQVKPFTNMHSTPLAKLVHSAS